MYGLVTAVPVAIGAVRAAIGHWALAVYLARIADKSKPTFEQGWDFINRYSWFFRGRKATGSKFKANWRNLAYQKLNLNVNRDATVYTPKIETIGLENLKRASNAKAGVVLVTVHTRLVTSALKVFEDNGIDFVTMGRSKPGMVKVNAYGLAGIPDHIRSDETALLVARKALRSGKLIYCCVDFFVRKPGFQIYENLIGNGLFELSKRCRSAMVFSMANVTEDGTIQISFSEPIHPVSEVSVEQMMDSFRSFVMLHTANDFEWKFGNMSMHPRALRGPVEN